MVLAQVQDQAQNFNADFYITIATVIPILFLAVAVQTPVYDDALKAALKAWKRADDLGTLDENTSGRELAIAYFGLFSIWAAILGGAFIIVCGVLGEILALLALEGRHAEGGLLVYTIALTLATAAAPLVSLGRSLSAYLQSIAANARAADAEIAEAKERIAEAQNNAKLPKARRLSNAAEWGRTRVLSAGCRRYRGTLELGRVGG